MGPNDKPLEKIKKPAMRASRKFTILHSNDMHGDFLAEVQGAEGNLIGGLSLLSGYLSKVRGEEKNVLYLIAGDMVQGSMIDSEYKGISTMEIMNYLAPDVVTLGNHEMDYGLPHLLFLEKMANFPIVNANLYLKKYHRRLMRPYLTLDIDGFKIMFIGIITEEVLKSLRMDSDIATFVGLEDAVAEVGKICSAYKDEDIDLTILLTHIGFEEDKKLAAMLDPAWGVDRIIGGHSHTILEQPAEVNGVLITQAGTGTDQIGRFDITVDDDTNAIIAWKWQLVPVNDAMAEPDADLQKFIDSFKEVVDRKYNRVVCRLAQKLTHPKREQETALGNMFADIAAQHSHADVAFIGSGSLRATEMGPIVTLGDLKRIYPYDDTLYRATVTGAQLIETFTHLMRPENRIPGESSFIQVSKGVRAVYDDTAHKLASLTINEQPVQESAHYTICLQEYDAKSPHRLNLPEEALNAISKMAVVTTSPQAMCDEYLSARQNLHSTINGLLTFTS